MVTWGHDPLDDRIFFKEALSLRKAYPQVTILAVGHQGSYLFKDVSIVTVDRGRHGLRVLYHLALAARRERAFCYHLHEPQLILLASFLKLFYRAKIVYDAHEHIPEMMRDFSTRSHRMAALLAAFFSLIEKMLVRIADGVVVVSDHLANRYSRFSKFTEVIYNYPRMDIFDGAINPLSTVEKQKDSPPIIIYHGQISRARNISVLIEAIKVVSQTIQDVRLILLGPVFGPSYRAELIRMIEERGISDLVELRKPISHDQVPAYIVASNVGLVVLPSREVFRESLPIKLFEYMSCGTPVVCSNLPAMQRIINETACGLLVDPGDVSEIAAAIVYLIENPQIARAMGMRGRKAVEDRYNWQRMEERLLTFYAGLSRGSC